MVFVESNAFDVVPRSGLMAEEALTDLGFFHFRHAHRNHLEVHHVVAGRGLMALGAGLRDGRRMAEFRDRPLRRGVALRAVAAEQSDVSVLGLTVAVNASVTSCTALRFFSAISVPSLARSPLIWPHACVAEVGAAKALPGPCS